MTYPRSSRHIALLALLGSLPFACKPGAATSETEGGETSTTGESSTESSTSGTGSTTEVGESDSTEGESSSTTDATDLCDAGEFVDETIDACGCTLNTCKNGVWEACDDDEWPQWCGVNAMLYSVTYCASDTLDCGAVLESCGDDFFQCQEDPSLRVYDETALDCTIAAMRDRTPGTYGWESTLDGNYSGDAGVFHLREDGAAWARQCGWEDLGSSMDRPSGLDLESPAYFDACLGMEKASDRWQCMIDGLNRTAEIALCGDGTGGPPPLGTCEGGGVAWAGSAIFDGSHPAALDKLKDVECVQGPLYVDGVPCSDVLDALASVRRIDGALTLRDLEVEDLTALSSLTEVGGRVTIHGLKDATSLSGLSGLSFVPNKLELYAMPKLADLTGLEGLTSVESLILRELGIATLDGLGAVSPETLEIWDCDDLSSLAGLEGMTTAKNVRLLTIPSLSSFSGLANLESVEFLQISGTGATDLSGFDSLAQVSAFDVNGDALLDAGPLPALVSLGRFSSRYSPVLASLSGLAQITQLVEGLSLSNLDALADLSGLSSLQLTGDLDIRQCHALTDLQGLGALETTATFSLDSNDGLTSVAGLDALTTVDGRFVIRQNPELLDLAGMVLAPSVSGEVQLWKNPSLTSLAGLEGVTSIVGRLQITGNSALTSIVGILQMTQIDGDLEIVDNPQLPTQDALDFAAAVPVTGDVDISGNG